jgi:hypothetical protein
MRWFADLRTALQNRHTCGAAAPDHLRVVSSLSLRNIADSRGGHRDLGLSIERVAQAQTTWRLQPSARQYARSGDGAESPTA